MFSVMSTKSITVATPVYDRLLAEKREGESFSETIDRLLSEVEGVHTGDQILRRLNSFTSLPDEDAERFMDVVAKDRTSEKWRRLDLP